MKEKLRNLGQLALVKYRKITTLMAVFAMTVLVNLTANAEESSGGNITSGMTTSMTTAFNAVKADVISIITAALPAALAIMGIVIAISVGLRFFKRFAK